MKDAAMVTVIRRIVDTVTPLSLRFRSKCVAFGTFIKHLHKRLAIAFGCCVITVSVMPS